MSQSYRWEDGQTADPQIDDVQYHLSKDAAIENRAVLHLNGYQKQASQKLKKFLTLNRIKMETKNKTIEEIKSLISSNADLREDLPSYIKEYVEWVEKEIPSGLEAEFGVGVAGKSHQFGSHWWFYNEEKDRYTCTGRGYYIANDFSAWVEGSTAKQMRHFAKQIPSYVESGLKAIKEENAELEEILRKQISFEG